MSNKKFDFLIFIGRFQPLHRGHLAVIETGLQNAAQLIILCGSAQRPRGARNPWTAAERETMIRGAVPAAANARIHVVPLTDIQYKETAWLRQVQAAVNDVVNTHSRNPDAPAKIGFIGDNYPTHFPQWDTFEIANLQGINATQIREAVFSADADVYLNGDAAHWLPDNVRKQLIVFRNTADYAELMAERAFIAEHKRAWSVAPYPPVLVTVDTLLVQSGHVLMVERDRRPGKGLLALPGGFVDPDERLINACLRELREETCLQIPTELLKGALKRQQVFDHPYRSSRGRTITHVFYFELEPNKLLPKVEGGDDARRAMWLPLADINPACVFEDHYFIIQEMLGIY
jgi:bifunctional NMN adenylyltransferase/nudix hydrolase